MKTVQEVLQLSADYLKKKGVANPRRQAEELLCDVLEMERMQLYLAFDRPLDNKETEACRTALGRRAQGEPLAYIRGKVDFYDCEILVTPDVLIPRPETEILIDQIVKELKGQDLAGKELWDICCGSGCMGIAIKNALPELRVTLSDISSKALRLARDSAQHNEVAIKLVEGDLFAPFQGFKTHFLVCNPPYISQQEYQQLDPEVRDFEPSGALIGGVTGLEFYERMASSLRDYLEPGGKAWFEIGYQQGSDVTKIFEKWGWKQTLVQKDWAGHDRFFSLENE